MIANLPVAERARILVVDDNEDFASNLVELAAFAGHDAVAERTLAGALRQLRDGTYDVAIVDQRLPDGSGLDVLAEANRLQPDLVNVVVTAFASLDNTVAALNAGAFAFVTKDSDPELLLDALRRAIETARLKSENRRLRVTQEGILASIPDLLLMVDADGCVTGMNRAHGVFCPMKPSGAARVPLVDLVSPLVRDRIDWAALLAAAAQDGEAVEASLTVREPEGGSRYYSVRFSPLARARPEVLVQITDLSERIGLERRLAESEGLAGIGRLASVIAHEMRNPLTGIRALAQLLQKRLPADQPGRDYVDEMLVLVDRMGSTLADLLQYAKPRDAREEDVSMRELLEEVAREARRWPACEARSLRVAVERSDDPTVHGERDRLFSALANLTENALHAVPEGGEVVLRLLGGPRRCVIAVEDSGKGIDPHDVPRVFEPFFTRKPGGTGLGLAIVKKVVDAVGGSIRADRSADLGGACFTIDLPVSASRPWRGR